MNILVAVAHPDDEILGAGGTIHKHLEAGDDVHYTIISKGRKDKIDQKFDTLPIVKIISTIEQAVKKYNPDVVYTHVADDINKDHQIVHEAVKIACRPTKSKVKAIYGFDSTFSPFNSFTPDYYVTLSQNDIEWKADQMVTSYSKEMSMPYRTVEGIYNQANFWGMKIGVEYVEAFKTILLIN